MLGEHLEGSHSAECFVETGAEERSESTSSEEMHHNIMMKLEEISARRALRAEQFTILLR